MFQPFPCGSIAPSFGGHQARTSQQAADRYAVLHAIAEVKARRKAMPSIGSQMSPDIQALLDL